MEYLDLFSLVDQINHLGKTSDRTQEPAANALGGDGILADITLWELEGAVKKRTEAIMKTDFWGALTLEASRQMLWPKALEKLGNAEILQRALTDKKIRNLFAWLESIKSLDTGPVLGVKFDTHLHPASGKVTYAVFEALFELTPRFHMNIRIFSSSNENCLIRITRTDTAEVEEPVLQDFNPTTVSCLFEMLAYKVGNMFSGLRNYC